MIFASTIKLFKKFINNIKQHFITINQTVDYMARGFMSFMRGVDITRAIGRVGVKVEPVLGPKQARLSNQPFQWPKYVMSRPRIKLIKPRAI